MLAVSRHRHRPLAPWRVMIILSFLRRIAGLDGDPPPPPAWQHRMWARVRTRQARRSGIQIAFFCHHRACRGTLTGAAEKVAQCSLRPPQVCKQQRLARYPDQKQRQLQLAWISLSVEITVYAAELNVVLARRLWPRSIVQPPLTEADRAVLAAQALQNQRRDDQRVHVSYDDMAPRAAAATAFPRTPKEIIPPAPSHGDGETE
jgi:hypothetical protein